MFSWRGLRPHPHFALCRLGHSEAKEVEFMAESCSHRSRDSLHMRSRIPLAIFVISFAHVEVGVEALRHHFLGLFNPQAY